MKKIITYRTAITFSEFEAGKKLFEEYVESLNVDLSFQGFAHELKAIGTQYGNPAGALLLALDDNTFVGCAGIRRLDDETAELKRMYVKSQYRGCHIGVTLLQRSIQVAKQLGYKKLRLDTLANMAKAQKLYSAFGFHEIPQYRFNPLPGTVYMEREL
ncbi:MAG: GNAT family N-acetyltransferase [Mucilaginibacter sp.]